jgi:enterobactin synthetase component D
VASAASTGGATRAVDLPFGRLVGVALPAETDVEAMGALAAALLPEERAHAAALPPARRATWTGGRVALRAALADVGVTAGPLFATPRGAPALPAGAAGSISHKPALALALAARVAADAPTTLGIDLEIDIDRMRAPRVDIARHVLTSAERARADALPPATRAREVLVAFAAKEAIYKALDPWVRRFVSFGEVELARHADGALEAALSLRTGEGPFCVELDEVPWDGFLVVAARVRPRL